MSAPAKLIAPATEPAVSEADGDFGPLDDCERGVVAIFVSVADVLGFARSLGEIYGLAYISVKPIHLAEVCGRLQMSKGSASQGLRTLRDLGALKPVYVAGDRRDYFEPELKIKLLMHRVLSERLSPHIDRSTGALEGLKASHAAQSALPAEVKKHRKERLVLLDTWQKRVSSFLPLISRLLR